MKSKHYLVSVGLHTALALCSAVTLYPVLWVVKLALTKSQSLSLTANPWPVNPTLIHFKDVLLGTDDHGRWIFGHQLFSSLVVATLTTVVGLSLSVTAAYALSRFRFPGRQASLQFLLITQMFPGTLTIVPLYSLLQKLGLLDSLTGLVVVYSATAVPFCVWMLKGAFDAIPKELEEAATIDGASAGQIFRNVVLPLVQPAIAVTALFSFMTAWNEFVLAATLLNDASRFTLPVALQRYVGEYKTEWGHFAAGAIIVSAPVMALFFALQRFLVGGLTAGAVKG